MPKEMVLLEGATSVQIRRLGKCDVPERRDDQFQFHGGLTVRHDE
jgi:hypothetical protein